MATTNLGMPTIPENSLQPGVAVNSALVTLDAAVAGTASLTMTDANYTLLPADYQASVLVIGGTLTAGRDVVFPAAFPSMLVTNNTGQTLTLKKTGQTGVALAATESVRVSSGVTDVVNAGAGTVSSVNGQSGAVVLDDGDVKSVVTALTSGTTVTVDCSLGRNFTLTLWHNVGTLTLSNLAGSGYATEIEIEIKQDGTGGWTFALPASFKALGGSDTAIAAAANAVTVLSAKTFDNGTTWRYAMQESA